MRNSFRAAAATLFLSLLPSGAFAAPTFYGPTSYLSFADSPFNPASFGYFYLETFEDHSFNTPGVSSVGGDVTSKSGFSGTIIDSVDGDDGNAANGTCDGCDSFFGNGAAGFDFIFDALTLGSLPTAVGIVWTDGAGSSPVTFEAFGAGGLSLGTVGPNTLGDGTNNESTAEDRFYGVADLGGISKIHISDPGGGIEVDHLQYGGPTTAAPEPATLALLGLGMLGLRRRRAS